jgi:hypothetical protein
MLAIATRGALAPCIGALEIIFCVLTCMARTRLLIASPLFGLRTVSRKSYHFSHSAREILVDGLDFAHIGKDADSELGSSNHRKLTSISESLENGGN